MHDVMNNALSHNANFGKFHSDILMLHVNNEVGKMVFMHNFDDLPDTIRTSPTMVQNKKIKLESLHFNLKNWT
jgi:hypothetical protein